MVTDFILQFIETHDFVLDRKAFVFDINTQQRMLTLTGHPSTVKVVKAIPQSNVIITASVFQMRLWDIRTGKTEHTLNNDVEEVWEASCNQLYQSSGIVTDNYEENGRRNAIIPIGEAEICALDTDPTGQWMFSNYKGNLRCWDLRQCRSFEKLNGDDNFPITSISVQPAEDATGRLEIFCGHSNISHNSQIQGRASLYSINIGTVNTKYSKIDLTSPVYDIIPSGRTFFVGTANGVCFNSLYPLNALFFQQVLRYSTVDWKREGAIPRTSNTALNKLCFVRSIVGSGTLLAAGYDDGIIKYFDYEGRQSLNEVGMVRKFYILIEISS